MATINHENKRVNGIKLDVLNETVSAIKSNPDLGRCRFRATNRWTSASHNCTTVRGFYAAGQELEHKQKFSLHADEPPLLAGRDQAANPVEHLLHALASCVTTATVAHAPVRGIVIHELESELEGDIDIRGFFGLANDVPKGFTNIRFNFRVKTDEPNLDRLKSLALFSPVYNTLTNGTKVDIQLHPKI